MLNEQFRTLGARLAVDDDTRAWGTLTHQELIIAQLVRQGFTNRQIGRRMFLSAHTINYHLRRIFKKLGIASRTQLAGLAQLHRDG
jgi:DNA-binding CsgD family transcriptional regulator